MSQTTKIVAALAVAFVLFVARRGEIGNYIGVFAGTPKAKAQ